jgi:hypothetical protein
MKKKKGKIPFEKKHRFFTDESFGICPNIPGLHGFRRLSSIVCSIFLGRMQKRKYCFLDEFPWHSSKKTSFQGVWGMEDSPTELS